MSPNRRRVASRPISPTGTLTPVLTIALVATLAVALATSTQAADRTWNARAGGVFGSAANWTPASVPGAGDIAILDIDTNYVVTLTAPAASQRLDVAEGIVRVDLGAFEYALRGLLVGENNGDRAQLLLENGLLSVTPRTPPHFVRIGKQAGAIGELVIGANADMTSTEVVIIGDRGRGTLVFEAGGDLDSVRSFIADDAGSVGIVIIDGAGSTWESTGTVFLANGGRARVEVLNGARWSTTGTFGADDAGAAVTVVVRGAGSTWTELASSFFGNAGVATLVVDQGGVVTWSGTSRLGDEVGASGDVTVDGAGSRWALQSELFVGNDGAGAVDVRGGGRVETVRVKLGDETGAAGTATITGVGTTWADGDEMFVGNRGTGTLTISGGGVVTGVRATIGDDPGGRGVATVTGAGSRWACTQTLTVGSLGRGALTLSDGAQVSASTVSVGTDGTLAGIGTIAGSVSNGGTVRPGVTTGAGAGPGTLVVQGGYSQGAAGRLEVEIGCAASDMLDVSGTAQLGGTLVVSFAGGMAPPRGQARTIIDAASVTGGFTQIIAPPGVQVTIDGGGVSVLTPAGPPEIMIDGEVSGDGFGTTVANAGDVDRDGVDDLVVGAPYNDANGTSAGAVFVYSGRTSALLWTRRGSRADSRLGWSVAAAGDVNRDGYDDVVAGAPYDRSSRGRIRVLSGRDGRALYTKNGRRSGDRFGWSVSGGVDVDGDGTDDFLAGAPRNDDAGSNAGKVYVYSGRDGRTVGTVEGENRGDAFGWSVAALGRANSDRFADFVVGAPLHDARGSKTGRVYVISGRRLDVFDRLTGKRAGDRFGYTVAALGRVDGDGREDFAVGAPWHDPSGRSNAGRVDVFSGADGSRIWAKTGWAAGDFLGWAIASAGDQDGDGRGDVLLSSPWDDGAAGNAGRVDIRAGAGGRSLGLIRGGAAGDILGHGVAALGDIDGDRIPELALGAPRADNAGTNAGGVVVRFSTACGGDGITGPWESHRLTRAADPTLDLDRDGVVGAGDLALVLSRWGLADARATADLQADGMVDVDDVLRLIRAWMAER